MQSKPNTSTPGARKLYVIVRRDLPVPYRYVQGMHAVEGFALLYGSPRADPTTVCLDVDDEIELFKLKQRLGDEIAYVFREPDLNNQETAVAAVLNPDRVRNLQLSRI